MLKLAHKKIRHIALQDKIISAQEAATWIKDGMLLGMIALQGLAMQK